MPHCGVLVGGAGLAQAGPGHKRLRSDERRFGLPRFVRTVARAGASVSDARPGPPLVVGDLSAPRGGAVTHHASHRTGRDVDLLLYLETLDGRPVASPGFLPVGDDGLAWDEEGQRFLRLDVAREWLLVKALVEDPAARVQWLFVHRSLSEKLLAWGAARGEPPETLRRAAEIMLQPPNSGLHDDHVHVRTACTAEEVLAGCVPSGPERPWLSPSVPDAPPPSDAALARELFEPLFPVDGPAR